MTSQERRFLNNILVLANIIELTSNISKGVPKDTFLPGQEDINYDNAIDTQAFISTNKKLNME